MKNSVDGATCFTRNGVFATDVENAANDPFISARKIDPKNTNGTPEVVDEFLSVNEFSERSSDGSKYFVRRTVSKRFVEIRCRKENGAREPSVGGGTANVSIDGYVGVVYEIRKRRYEEVAEKNDTRPYYVRNVVGI